MAKPARQAATVNRNSPSTRGSPYLRGAWQVESAGPLGAVAGVYTYYFYDIASNTLQGVLPLKQVSFNAKLKDAGELTAVIEMGDPGVQAIGPVALTQTARTSVFVDRDGALLWGGPIWKTNYRSVDQTMSIDAEDFSTYLSRRVLAVTKSYASTDPLAISQDLLTYTASLAGGDIGLQVVVVGSGAVAVSQTWSTWDLKVILEAINDLASSSPGFEWSVDVSWGGGQPVLTLTLAYPRIGRTAPDSGLVWEYPPGNIDSYEWPEDGTEVAVTAYAVGSGEGASMLLAAASTPSMLDDGYPLLEAVYSHKDVTDPTTLSLYAQADAAAHSAPSVLPVLYVRADMDPVLGGYGKGDDCRVRITDPRFPAVAGGAPGLDAYYRIQEVEVTPQDDQFEAVKLTLGPTS